VQLRPRRSILLAMGRPCSICAHPERESIDRALLEATGFRVLSTRYRVTSASLLRHRDRHLPATAARSVESAALVQVPVEVKIITTPTAPTLELPAPAQAPASETKADPPQGLDALAQLRAINGACLEVLRKARADGQPRILLQAVDRISRQIELQARILGQINEAATISVAISPEWHGIRQRVLDALRPHAEARLAVVEALKGLEA
jgi:hypothetical protein